jgi:hypothetical protein
MVLAAIGVVSIQIEWEFDKNKKSLSAVNWGGPQE